MNKHAMHARHATRKHGQAGFTLIELIVVIVILGILAATALPKFANLSGDARVASLSSARGALQGTASMMHGQWLVNPALAQVNNENFLVNFSTYNIGAGNVNTGYPYADANLANAAGVTGNDYTIIASQGGQNASATMPAIPPKGFVVIPNAIANTASAVNCFISYTEAQYNAGTGIVTPPVLSPPPAASSCR